ncbi:RNA-directed DNA polymerase, eukaryota [Tanacetum coccineum]
MNVMSLNIQGLGQSAKKQWIRELNTKNKINFVAIQETKLESINLFSIKDLWGNSFFDFSFSSSVGLSGGILCVWDPNSFVKDNATISDYFVAVRGTWLSTATKVMFVSIYAPQDISEKKSLWEYITHIIDTWDGECIILGDFNEVRSKQERFGTIFNETAANAFNHFISTAGLIDLPLEGYSFTWAIKSAKKMSKLDRFLISKGLLLKFPSLSAIYLDRHLSDHRPIIMRETRSSMMYFRALLNSPVGPKTTHFWGPVSNLGFFIAGVADLQKPPEMLSGNMTGGTYCDGCNVNAFVSDLYSFQLVEWLVTMLVFSILKNDLSNLTRITFSLGKYQAQLLV